MSKSFDDVGTTGMETRLAHVETRLAQIETKLDQLLERLPDFAEVSLPELQGGCGISRWLAGLSGMGAGGIGGILVVAVEKIVGG